MTPEIGKIYRIDYSHALPDPADMSPWDWERAVDDMYQGLAKCIALGVENDSQEVLHQFNLIEDGKETGEEGLFADEDIVEEVTGEHTSQEAL